MEHRAHPTVETAVLGSGRAVLTVPHTTAEHACVPYWMRVDECVGSVANNFINRMVPFL
jgi:hypothetical protein